jgi:hypothetical protein
MHITDIDNRGTEAVPFGYVYFDDGARVGYTGGEGWAVFGGGGWPETPEHREAAKAHLVEHGNTVPEEAGR